MFFFQYKAPISYNFFIFVVVSAVAIKLECIKTKHPQLHIESKFYRIMQGGVGIPTIKWCGSEGDFNVMVMELLGPSLEDLFNFCSRCVLLWQMGNGGSFFFFQFHSSSTSWSPLPLLQTVQPEDGAVAGRPAHLQDRVHPLQELHPSGHQAGQLPHVSERRPAALFVFHALFPSPGAWARRETWCTSSTSAWPRSTATPATTSTSPTGKTRT